MTGLSWPALRILEVDPEAFIIVNRINEVKGRGFTLNKVYR